MPDSTAGAPRRPTLVDVARAAGVSRATASLVIRDAPGPSATSRERVRAAAEELGYRPDSAAQSLRRKSSGLIGVTFRTDAPFHADVVERLYPAAEAAGYDLVLSAVVPTRDERRAVDALVASRCEALLLIGATEPPEGVPAEMPVIGIGRPEAPGPDAVFTDDRRGFALLVDHLADRGHRRIVHVDGGASSGAAERRAGFEEAMARRGLVPVIVRGDNTEAAGTEAARSLLATGAPLPTAVMAVNDQAAVGLLIGLREAGVDVPGRVSVTGYDDSRIARLAHVDLTTVRQDPAAIAEAALRIVRDRLRTDPPDGALRGIVELDPELVVRGTTGPAPTAP
ncbi:LacI family DNA-binding transcriptional regulator [Tsukamurella sp. 1534]|uniref:LacI family DNA-binding transcriptional regulator n=1 Tax=Tsukamurella sp. 1534 TaxID=1151061 RepID=UPI00059454F2|nr:LacI family DNA-binding transcriptional regulator [Tsukamurella sp. 1534]